MTAEFRVKRDGRKLDHRALEEIRKMAAEHQRGLGGQREEGILVFHLPRRAQWRVVGGTAQEVDAPAQEAAASGAGWLARPQKEGGEDLYVASTQGR